MLGHFKKMVLFSPSKYGYKPSIFVGTIGFLAIAFVWQVFIDVIIILFVNYNSTYNEVYRFIHFLRQQ